MPATQLKTSQPATDRLDRNNPTGLNRKILFTEALVRHGKTEADYEAHTRQKSPMSAYFTDKDVIASCNAFIDSLAAENHESSPAISKPESLPAPRGNDVSVELKGNVISFFSSKIEASMSVDETVETDNDILSVEVTFLPEVNKPGKFKNITLLQALGGIKKGRWKSMTDKVQSAYLAGIEVEFKRLKAELPSICFNGVFQGRLTNGNFVKSSGLVMTEIDKIPLGELEKIRKLLESCPYVVAVFESVSGSGLTVLFRVDPKLIVDDASFKQAFAQIEAFLAAMDITVDPSCKDIRRVKFVSTDPNLYVNEGAEMFPLDSGALTKVSEITRVPTSSIGGAYEGGDDSDFDEYKGPLPDIDAAEKALPYLPPPDSITNREEWTDVVKIVSHQFGDDPEAEAMIDEWSSKVYGYQGTDDVLKTYRSFNRPPVGANVKTFKTLVKAFHEREAAKSWEEKLEEHVIKMNKTHASVVVGGKHKIMRTIPARATHDGREAYEFFNRNDLSLVHDNHLIQIGLTQDGRPMYKNALLSWARHPKANSYIGGVVFLPGRDTPPNYCNTWRGFSIEPKQNNALLKRLYSHIFEVICGGDQELFNYFTNWTAYTMQNPGKPAGAAVVLRGEKGSGKSILGHFLKCLWGNHGIHISNSKLLVGSFNGHLADVCFVFADEAFYSGDKQHENILKANVTEPTIQIERKGIDAVTQPNYLKIFMATNHKYAVPATRDERRFCVFDVSSHRIGDRKYFDDLLADCNSEDVQAAFLYAMLNTDLTGWHTGDIPDSVGLRAQRYHTMKAHQKWMADCLTAGTFETREYHQKAWEEVVPAQILYDRYIAWCDASRIGEYGRESQTTFGAYIGKIFERRRLGGDRATTYFFGTLAEATTRFEEYEKVKLSELMPTSTLSENT